MKDASNRLGSDTLRKAERYLQERDAVLASIMVGVGPCQLGPGRDGFSALVGAVISQQLSNAAAAAIRQRVETLVGGIDGVSPQGLLSVQADDLRKVGVSAQKTECIRNMAESVMRGDLCFERIAKEDDETVVEMLTEIKGIGRWTAEMYLMFSLNRSDVFPLYDAAIARAITRAYCLSEGSEADLLTISERWRPYRTVASWYMYKYLDTLPTQVQQAAPMS